MDDRDTVIGIDLGTSNCCAAYYYNGKRGAKTNVIETEEGKRVTPSFVFFPAKNKVSVGSYARSLAVEHPELGIFGIKRLIGRRFDDPKVQSSLKYFPFPVEKSVDNDPVVVVNRKDGTVKKSPEDVCTVILQKIKKDAERKLRKTIDKAVITVPAYFSMNQRRRTLDAANKAGFTVLKLMNEPTAAALSFYYENECEDNSYSIVYDLGGGTFDVSILKKNGDNIDIIGVSGDSHLGGYDFDSLIVDYVRDLVLSKYNFDLALNKKGMKRLYQICEEAKEMLSFHDTTKIQLAAFHETHKNITFDFTRVQFETMADKLFTTTIDIIDNCLKDCNLEKQSIDYVILSGGSTRIPKIENMIASYFNGKEIIKSNNLDECVAEGAALQAAMFSKDKNQKINDIQIRDVVPLSLGIETFPVQMTFLIKRNSFIPTSNSHIFYNSLAEQTSIQFSVYEGERTDSRKNRHLGDITIGGLTPAPPRQCEIECKMEIDHNGILTVTAREKFRNNEKSLKVCYARGDRSDKEVMNALKDAEENIIEDKMYTEFANLKGYLLKYYNAVKYNLEKKDIVLSYKEIYQLCKEKYDLAENLEMEDGIKLNELILEAESKCELLVKKYTFLYMPVKT